MMTTTTIREQTRCTTKLIIMKLIKLIKFQHVNLIQMILLALVAVASVAAVSQSTSNSLIDKQATPPPPSPPPPPTAATKATTTTTSTPNIQNPNETTRTITSKPLADPIKRPWRTTVTNSANKQQQPAPPNGFRISASKQAGRRLVDELVEEDQDRLKDGAGRVRRVARNVRKKLEQMSGRVDQLESIIAQDHDEQQQQRLANQSSQSGPGETSQSGGGSGASDNSNSNNAGLWSARLDDVVGDDTGDQNEPGAQNQTGLLQPAASEPSKRWNPPVIRSVIPDRQFASGSGGGDNDESPPDSADSPAQADYSGSQQHANSIEMLPASPSNQNTSSTSDEQTAQTAMPSMMGPEWTSNQNYHYFSEENAKNHGGGSINSNGLAADSPFQQLSAETGRSSIVATAGGGGKFQNMTIVNSDTDLVNSYSAVGPTTMGLMQLTQQGQLHNSTDNNLGQNSTTTTTRRPGNGSQMLQATDSKPKATRKGSGVYTYSVANYGKNSRDLLPSTTTTSTTSRPIRTQTNGEDAHNWPHQHYQQQQQQDYLNYSDGNNNHNNQTMAGSSEAPIVWPTLATPAPFNDRHNHNDQMHSEQIGLPPSESDLPASNRYMSVMQPSSSARSQQHQQRSHHHHRQPVHRLHRASQNEEDQQRQQNTARDHQGARNSNGNGQTDEAPMGQQSSEPNVESNALSAHRYSMALPVEITAASQQRSPASFNTEPDQNRHRSIEARRQLVTSIDTTLYEHKHHHQPPPSMSSNDEQQRQPPDTYSSRVDNQPLEPVSVSNNNNNNNTSSSTHNQQQGGGGHNLAEANSLNPHNLKHRSSSNPMMLDDQATMGNNYPAQSGDNQSASVFNFQQQHQQQQQQMHDMGQVQAQSNQASDGSINSYYQLPQNMMESQQHQSFRPAGQQQQQQQHQFEIQPYYSTSRQLTAASDQQQDTSATANGPDIGQDAGSSSQQNLLSQLDQLSDQNQISRPYPFGGTSSLMGQYYSTPTSIQDSLQAASTNHNEQQQRSALLSQQRANQIDNYNAHVLRYQAQQRALANQLANQQQQLQRHSIDQQQQQQQQSAQASSKIARAYQEFANNNQQMGATDSTTNQAANSLGAAIQNGMLRQYSPETKLAHYLTARSASQPEPSGGSGGGTALPEQQYYSQQQYYPSASASYMNQLAKLATYQRLIQAQAQQQQQQQQVLPASGSPSYQLSSMQFGSQPSSSLQAGSNSYGGNMYATSAMNQPVIYDSSQQSPGSTSSSSSVSSGGGSGSGGDMSSVSVAGDSTSPAPVSTNGGRLPLSWTSSSGSSSSGPSRRNYFANLLKPTASSRYYYTPTLLSPAISLASPTGLHAIYAPAASAATHHQHPYQQATAETAPSLAQYFTTAAATSPYAQAAVMLNQAAAASHPHQTLTHGSFADAQAISAHNYQQALMNVMAAANGGYHPAAHYMNPAAISSQTAPGISSGGVPDADMAESSLVPSDGSTSYAAPTSSGGSQADGSALNGDSNDNSASGGNGKTTGSMKQWLTVASLLAGILPMGLVMASMLPMLSVAGRKKRELELGAHNFSDIFGSWRPSRILKALMQPYGGEAVSLANATRLLNELVTSAQSGSGGAELRSSRQLLGGGILGASSGNNNHNSTSLRSSARLLGGAGGGTGSSIKNRLLGGGSSLLGAGKQYGTETASSSQLTVQQPNSTSLISPQLGTTPMPSMAMAGGGGGSSGSGISPFVNQPIKSTLKKVLDRVNNLIVTAQKRKHRSSLMDLQWAGGQAGNGGGLRSVLSFGELKRYLADLVRARLLADQQQPQLVTGSQSYQHEPNANSHSQHQQLVANNYSTLTNGRENPDQPPVTARATQKRRGLFNASPRQEQITVAANQQQQQTSEIVVAELQVNNSEPITKRTNGTSSTAAISLQLETPINEPPGSRQHTQQPSAAAALNEVQLQQTSGQASKSNNFDNNSKAPLLACLYKVVCDLASKLRRSSRIYQEQQQSNSTNLSPADLAADKQMTRLILEQLMDHIEAADRETLIFGEDLRGARNSDKQHGQHQQQDDEQPRSPMNQIQKAVLRNECAQLFTCSDPRQFKRTFSELRWPKRK